MFVSRHSKCLAPEGSVREVPLEESRPAPSNTAEHGNANAPSAATKNEDAVEIKVAAGKNEDTVVGSRPKRTPTSSSASKRSVQSENVILATDEDADDQAEEPDNHWHPHMATEIGKENLAHATHEDDFQKFERSIMLSSEGTGPSKQTADFYNEEDSLSEISPTTPVGSAESNDTSCIGPLLQSKDKGLKAQQGICIQRAVAADSNDPHSGPGPHVHQARQISTRGHQALGKLSTSIFEEGPQQQSAGMTSSAKYVPPHKRADRAESGVASVSTASHVCSRYVERFPTFQTTSSSASKRSVQSENVILATDEDCFERLAKRKRSNGFTKETPQRPTPIYTTSGVMYVAGRVHALDGDWLQDHGVGLVVSVLTKLDNIDLGSNIERLLFSSSSGPTGSLVNPDHWRRAVEKVRRCFAMGRAVVVHCAAGIHRAPAVSAGLIAITQQVGYGEAYRMVENAGRYCEPWTFRKNLRAGVYDRMTAVIASLSDDREKDEIDESGHVGKERTMTAQTAAAGDQAGVGLAAMFAEFYGNSNPAGKPYIDGNGDPLTHKDGNPLTDGNKQEKTQIHQGWWSWVFSCCIQREKYTDRLSLLCACF